ncbi:hypothetical protein OSTOST_03141 [Ostertagia ostertagi]
MKSTTGSRHTSEDSPVPSATVSTQPSIPYENTSRSTRSETPVDYDSIGTTATAVPSTVDPMKRTTGFRHTAGSRNTPEGPSTPSAAVSSQPSLPYENTLVSKKSETPVYYKSIGTTATALLTTVVPMKSTTGSRHTSEDSPVPSATVSTQPSIPYENTSRSTRSETPVDYDSIGTTATAVPSTVDPMISTSGSRITAGSGNTSEGSPSPLAGVSSQPSVPYKNTSASTSETSVDHESTGTTATIFASSDKHSKNSAIPTETSRRPFNSLSIDSN